MWLDFATSGIRNCRKRDKVLLFSKQTQWSRGYVSLSANPVCVVKAMFNDGVNTVLFDYKALGEAHVALHKRILSGILKTPQVKRCDPGNTSYEYTTPCGALMVLANVKANRATEVFIFDAAARRAMPDFMSTLDPRTGQNSFKYYPSFVRGSAGARLQAALPTLIKSHKNFHDHMLTVCVDHAQVKREKSGRMIQRVEYNYALPSGAVQLRTTADCGGSRLLEVFAPVEVPSLQQVASRFNAEAGLYELRYRPDSLALLQRELPALVQSSVSCCSLIKPE